ncbi:GGDEF domain-containing protein [Ideonella alba]|uniref:diguanylate cyclase n=1 Tax=Ideonella alba TaxID=2824118 RepID=A0A941BM13_9BURK|nr:GGDEF domain-containing protein [Ideonella alba]MBQ0931774.1 GGDEF domain-containing protein [Ideonella alba]
MNNVNNTLLAVLAVQAALCGAGWWVGAATLSLSRSAALHWMGPCLCIGLGSVLFMPGLDVPLALSLPARNLLVLVGCMLLRRGNALFLRGDTADLEQALLLAVAVLAMLLIGMEPGEQWVRALTLSSAIGWVLLRGGIELVRGLTREHSWAGALTISLPMLLLGAALMGRAAAALVVPPQSPMLDLSQPSSAGTGLLLTALLVFGTTQLMLLYLVIMRLVRRLREVASQDPLTRLLNRRAWMLALQAERVRMQRHPCATAMAVIDIDGFRHLNQRYGNAQGDELLQQLARCLEETARATDVVARLGADQFGVLLSDTDADGATEAAERLRQAVAGLNLRVGEERVPLTISVGVAVQPADLALQLSFSALQLRADEALSSAKAGGGNRVQIDRRPVSLVLA